MLILFKSPTQLSVTILETIQPIFIESYRIIYVARKDKFKFAFDLKFVGLYEALLIITLAILISYKIIANFIFRDVRNGLFSQKSNIFTMISGCLGQGQFEHSKLISIVFVFVIFSFFVYINYVMQSGFIISLLTTDPPIKFRTFSAVLRSGLPIYTSEYDLSFDAHGQLKIG